MAAPREPTHHRELLLVDDDGDVGAEAHREGLFVHRIVHTEVAGTGSRVPETIILIHAAPH